MDLDEEEGKGVKKDALKMELNKLRQSVAFDQGKTWDCDRGEVSVSRP